MAFTTMTRAGAIAIAIALSPALAFAATPAQQTAGSHDCTRSDCPCAKGDDARHARHAAAAQVREREADEAFLKQVWTAP